MTWKNLGTALICIFHCAPCVPDSRPLYLQLSWFLPLLVISTETTLTKANCYSDLPYPTNSFSCNMIIIIVEIYSALDILDVFDTFDADSPKNSQLPWLSGHHSLLVSPLSLALSFLASSKCLFFPLPPCTDLGVTQCSMFSPFCSPWWYYPFSLFWISPIGWQLPHTSLQPWPPCPPPPPTDVSEAFQPQYGQYSLSYTQHYPSCHFGFHTEILTPPPGSSHFLSITRSWLSLQNIISTCLVPPIFILIPAHVISLLNYHSSLVMG